MARNMPFCDEFHIITDERYRYIVEGQLQAFQGLKYHCFLEQVGKKTAPAVAIACYYTYTFYRDMIRFKVRHLSKQYC
ncbi:hypothetical protein [Youngiibacter multivorans]|uniref:hypothetical protein n=1 Tax=Youngiibacter multivorans TaxID=937251 RepID=UPI003158DE8A